MVSLRSQDRSRTSKPAKPAKPARRDRKPPGTRKAPASPAKPGGAASAPAAALDWNRISYEPIEIKDLERGMAVKIWWHSRGKSMFWEGVIKRVGTPRRPWRHPDDVLIDIALSSGGSTSIDAMSSLLQAWRGTFTK